MPEKQIVIPGDGVKLEGLIQDFGSAYGGVVAHPHPQYGGSMHNSVVKALVDAFAQAGRTVLRFNFRGVGTSTGEYGDGLAEQADLAAAVEYLRQRGVSRVKVAGYSFGAWVAAHAWPKLKPLGVEPLILVAPPAAFMSFDRMPADLEIGLMVCGERDDIAPPDLVRALGKRLALPEEPVILPGADHFYSGREAELTRIVKDFLALPST